MTSPTLKITDKHRHALAQVVESFGAGRFRRSDLAQRIYPLTSPRSRDAANAISERVLREAAAAGRIRREGHLHWIKVGTGRQLLDGSLVPELSATQPLVLNTKCPAKWLAVDLETGDIWRGTPNGWKRHPGVHRKAVAELAAGGSEHLTRQAATRP